MMLFQYWNAEPPAAIAALMDALRDQSAGFDYVRLDEQAARAFVGREGGTRMLAAWDALALPVMQSDLLRLLLLIRHGGVYLDATYAFDRPLAELTARARHAQAPVFGAIMNGNYLMVREPGDAFLRACAEFVVANIEAHRFGSALMATGPGALNAVRCVLSPEAAPVIRFLAANNANWQRWGWNECVAAAEAEIAPTAERIAALARFDLVPVDVLQDYGRSLASPHRERDDHWLRWQASIYR